MELNLLDNIIEDSEFLKSLNTKDIYLQVKIILDNTISLFKKLYDNNYDFNNKELLSLVDKLSFIDNKRYKEILIIITKK